MEENRRKKRERKERRFGREKDGMEESLEEEVGKNIKSKEQKCGKRRKEGRLSRIMEGKSLEEEEKRTRKMRDKTDKEETRNEVGKGGMKGKKAWRRRKKGRHIRERKGGREGLEDLD